MRKFAAILITLLTLSTMAFADDVETKLYASCLAAGKDKSEGAQNFCHCQARKWASGKVTMSDDPSKSLEIKKEYIDELMTNWNQDIGVKNGAHLQGIEAERAVLAMGIGFGCAKELGWK